MGLPVEVNNLMMGSLGGYTVGRSLRFRSSASAYLNRTPAAASNRKTWTWSGWVKRGTLGANNILFSAGSSGTDRFIFNFNTTDNLTISNTVSGSSTTIRTTSAVYRDPSAWYHVVLYVDTSNSTAGNRTKLYVNGVEVTAFSTSNDFTLNYDGFVNNTNQHNIGVAISGAAYMDGYLAEVNFIDGQALTPSSFGAYDTNGVWQPKKYSGTYGTNGFYLPFSDNSSRMALGYSYAGGTHVDIVENDGSNQTVSAGVGACRVSTISTANASLPSASNEYLVVTPSVALPISSSLKIYLDVNYAWATGRNLYINGTQVASGNVTVATVSGMQEWTINIAGHGITSLSSLTTPQNSGGRATFYGISIDGTTVFASANDWTPNNIDVTSNNYRSFTTVGTYGWTAPAGVTSVNYLVVGGGGGGGGSSPNYVSGGGGGGGGVLSGTLSVTPGTTYTVTVGAGGTAGAGALGGNGGNGGNSVFATLTAIGGGGGGAYTAGPSTGGSGGGGANNGAGQAGAAGTSGQGNAGGNAGTYFNSTSSQGGGGGGGAGAAGSNFNGLNGGAGGTGIASTITGSTVYYGGGGGGGAANGTGGAAGSGGGGAGGSGNSSGGASGAANTGGGGGGASTQLSGSPTGGAGGSGIVILSYSGALQAGTTYDSMIDSPTNAAGTSTGIGNYAVLNPLYSAGGGTFSNGNLQVATGTSTAGRAIATMGVSSGKWYWEITPTSIPANVVSIGFVPNPTTNDSGTVGNNASEYGYLSDGQKFSGGSAGAYGASYVANDVIGVALDLDAGTLVFYKNGTSQGTAYSSIPLTNTYVPAVSDSSSSNSATFVANFGQRPFSYTPPSGYKALNTYNLPAPSIANGAQYMAATTYTGNGSTQSISNAVNGVSFQPDLVWIKRRNTAADNVLYDSVRTLGVSLSSNLTNAEPSVTNGLLTAFNSSGFGVAVVSSNNSTNGNADSYIGWQWKGGGTGVTNNSGTITSTVSASPSSGFSIATFTGTGANATVGHGLGVAPSMVIVKQRSGANGWPVYHVSQTSAAYYMLLNQTDASNIAATVWNSTAPTSSVFSIGTAVGVNTSGQTYVAYCFSAVSGYSAFGKYTGNGSADGPFIYTGFRPRWVMIKNTQDGTTNWYIYDTSRDTYNIMSNYLMSNLSNAEASFSAMDYLSNGFKIRTSNLNFNNSGQTHIYAAFAESPFQISRAR